MRTKLRDVISTWYEGELVPHVNDPSSPIMHFNLGTYRRHWTANLTHVLVEFWLEHWKWLIGVLIAIIGIVFRVWK